MIPKYKRAMVTECGNCGEVSTIPNGKPEVTVEALVPTTTKQIRQTTGSLACPYCKTSKGELCVPEQSTEVIYYAKITSSWMVLCYHYSSFEEMVKALYKVELEDTDDE